MKKHLIYLLALFALPVLIPVVAAIVDYVYPRRFVVTRATGYTRRERLSK